ncbi:MAG: hypothetical protein EOM92_21320 [Gammaproteobacteria bacterium]|nr:hypothetical protein [Gammaproteobacteria bacterium]
MRECHVAVSLVIPAGKLESSAMEGGAAAFVTAVAADKTAPIPLEEILEVARVSILAAALWAQSG